nr:minor capsid protein [uncultured Peptostreptococcus sp.]
MPRKSNYWIKRALERSRADIRSADEVVKTINDAFYNCLKEIEKEISVLYYRYAEDNELDYDLANKLLTGDEYKSFRMGLEEYMDLIDSPEIQLELNTLSTRSRISHLEETFFNIQKQIDKAYIYQHEAVESLMKESLQTNYHRVIFDIGVATGETVVKDFHKLTIGEIVKEFERPWSGKNFSERIWRNRAKLKDALEEEIVKMAISGADCTQAIESVAKKMDVSKRAAATLVHTEQAYFSSLGTLKAYSEMGVDKYIYVATLDLRTSDICRDLDHEVFSIKDAQAGVNYPPMHPRCRSTTAPYTGAMEGTRTARDMFNNEVKVDKSLSYKEWHKKYVESDPKYLIEEKKWKNRHSDKKQFEKYKNLGYDGVKLFDDFQKIKYNDTKEWDIVKGYTGIVQKGEISPLVKYSNFKKHHNELEDKLIGMKTTDGVKIKSVSYHFTGRAIGTHDWANPNNSKEIMKKLNHKHVPSEALLKCVNEGKLSKKTNESCVFYTEECQIAINPHTGNLVQCNRL